MLLNRADKIASTRYAPTGIVLDDHLKAVDYRGNMNQYLRPASISASLTLDTIFSAEFAEGVLTAIQDVRKGRAQAELQGVRIESASGAKLVDVEIVPFSEAGQEWYFIFILDKMDLRSTSEAEEYERHAMFSLDDLAKDPTSVIRRLKASNAWLRKRNAELVSARNVVEEERNNAESVIQGIRQPILILDASIRVVRANPAFLDLFDTTLEDIELRPLNELCGGRWNFEPLLMAMLNLMDEDAIVQDFEMEYPLPKDKRSNLSLNAAKIGWGGHALIVMTVDDITSRKRLLLRASEALQQRDQFMTALAYEVREPLQPLHDAATVLQNKNISVQETQQARSVLNRQLDQMIHAIDDHLKPPSPSPGMESADAEHVALDPPLNAGHDSPGYSRAAVSTPSFAGKRILVVDDNIDTAAMCALSLTLEGHVVEIAHDGPSALAIAQSFHPDIVVLDIGLPGMSGLDVAKDLRLHEEGKKVMIVGLSGYDQEAYRQQAEEAGFDHYLVKPSNAGQLNRVIATYH